MHRILALAVLLMAGQPALAEYGNTRWGMTPDEVRETVGGDARSVRDKKDERVFNHKRLVASTSNEAGLVYEVSYFFGTDGKGLTMVQLVPPSPAKDCAAMRAAYTQRLGPGEEQKRDLGTPGLDMNVIQWRTGPGDEIVRYVEAFVFGTASICKVVYQQRAFTME